MLGLEMGPEEVAGDPPKEEGGSQGEAKKPGSEIGDRR
jgi:hypothetical protein